MHGPSRTLEGYYVNGRGKASKRAKAKNHTSFQLAGVNLLGTYNIRVRDKDPFRALDPTNSFNGVHYWLVDINGHLGWAMRWDGSTMRQNTLEVYSRDPIPKSDKLRVTIFGKMDAEAFAHKMYKLGHKWFQKHSWLPAEYQRHDATRVVGYMGDLRGKTVLDQGACEGATSHAMARMGAKVTATEKRSAEVGQAISHHIEGLDIEWLETSVIPAGSRYDIVVSLSVWHQQDPTYDKLAVHLGILLGAAREAVYVELMDPPLKGSLRLGDLMTSLGFEMLYKYKHPVRRVRSVWGYIK